MISVERQLQNLYQHDILEPVFAARGLQAPWDLDVILEELGKMGEITLGSHDEEIEFAGVKQIFICSLRWRVPPTSGPSYLSATGDTASLAVLRCLMETLYCVRKQVNENMS